VSDTWSLSVITPLVQGPVGSTHGLVAVVGALVYALSSNAKVARMGEIAFFVGLLWLVYQLGSRQLHF
jgi:hypothetical protein